VRLLLLGLAVLAAPVAASPRQLTIAYQGDVGGEVAPCG
jgi:hypothetical protein